MNKHADNKIRSNSKKSEKKNPNLAAQRYKAKAKNGCRKEEAFEHAHIDPPVSLGRCLFSYEAGIANSRRVLHFFFWSYVYLSVSLIYCQY